MSLIQPSAPIYRDDNGAPSVKVDDTDRIKKLKSFCSKHEIVETNTSLAIDLRQLEQFNIVCVCDDSESMKAADVFSHSGIEAIQVYKDLKVQDIKQMTRWDELCKSIMVIIELAVTCLEKNGVDIYFFNRAPLLNVTSVDQVRNYFVATLPQNGSYAPMTRTLQQVFQDKAQVLSQGKLLCILATNSLPSDDNGNVQLQEFVDVIKTRPSNVYMSIAAFTNDKSVIELLQGFIESNNYTNVDMTENYRAEKSLRALVVANLEVTSKHYKYKFSFGDYIVKILLGGIDQSFSRKSLLRATREGYGETRQSGFCSTLLTCLITMLCGF